MAARARGAANLRPVPDDEPAELVPDPTMSVAEAASTGDQLDLLVALRARIATTISDPDTSSRDLASLSRRLMEIAREVEAIEASRGEGDGIDQAADTPDEGFDPDDL